MYPQSPPPPLSHVIRHLPQRIAVAAGTLAFALTLGIVGYHEFEGLSFLDSLLNASMILSGMGPITVPVSVGGKLFASFYALCSGIFFLTVTAYVFGPIVHRTLRRFHWELGQER